LGCASRGFHLEPGSFGVDLEQANPHEDRRPVEIRSGAAAPAEIDHPIVAVDPNGQHVAPPQRFDATPAIRKFGGRVETKVEGPVEVDPPRLEAGSGAGTIETLLQSIAGDRSFVRCGNGPVEHHEPVEVRRRVGRRVAKQGGAGRTWLGGHGGTGWFGGHGDVGIRDPPRDRRAESGVRSGSMIVRSEGVRRSAARRTGCPDARAAVSAAIHEKDLLKDRFMHAFRHAGFLPAASRTRRHGRSPILRGLAVGLVAAMLGSVPVACQKGPPSNVLLERADYDFKYGRYEQAADTYQQVLDRYPGDAAANLGLGRSLLELDRVAEARAALELAAVARPADFEVCTLLAEVMYRDRDTVRLYQMLRDQAVEHQRLEAWLLLAEYALALDDPDTAQSAITAALEVSDGTTPEPYLEAARFAERIGDQQEAVRRLRQAYGIAPQDPRVIAGLQEYGEVPGPTIALPPGR